MYKAIYIRSQQNEADKLVYNLVRLASSLKRTILNYPLEKFELDECLKVVVSMISSLVSIGRLDNEKLLKLFVISDNSIQPFQLELLNEAEVVDAIFSHF